MPQYLESSFTKNKILLTEKIVVKCCNTAKLEGLWYVLANRHQFPTPNILFCNDDTIITQRVYGDKPTAGKMIDIILKLKKCPSESKASFQTYIGNIKHERIRMALSIHSINDYQFLQPSFFHGDLSTTNVIGNYLIDPNYKGIFGNWQTDAAKAMFSFLVYEKDLNSAKEIAKFFGNEKLLWLLAAAEGSRVCKYNSKYVTFVNNILDIYGSI